MLFIWYLLKVDINMIIQSIIAIFRIFLGLLSCARIIVSVIPYIHIYITHNREIYGAPCFASGQAPLKRHHCKPKGCNFCAKSKVQLFIPCFLSFHSRKGWRKPWFQVMLLLLFSFFHEIILNFFLLNCLLKQLCLFIFG